MGYIYKLTNTLNGKAYIGQTVKKLETRINHHFNHKRCPALHNAIQKYGRDAFTLEILHEALDIFLDDLEVAEINKHNTLAPNGYNIEGGGNANKVLSDQTRQKISDALKGKTLSPEHRQKISDALKGRKGKTHTPETRQKISDAKRGKTHTPETRKKLSDLNKGKTLSPETRQKVSDARKGKTISPEHRKKLSEAHKRRKPPSLETRKKLSDLNKGKTLSPETCQKVSLNRAHPDRLEAFHILDTLPKGTSLAEKRKVLHKKFPEIPNGTIYSWVKKWSESSLYKAH